MQYGFPSCFFWFLENHNMMNLNRSARAMALAFGLVAPLGLGVSLSALPQAAFAQSAPQRGLPDFSELVDQVGPSVVNIRTTERVSARSGGTEQEMQEFFRRFFGDQMPAPRTPEGRGNTPRTPQAPTPDIDRPRGVGSGFILTADGFVLTNAHVVKGADEITVTLTDKREFKAKVIGADERTDVAVVKIEATGLPAVKIGNAERIKVGEWVMAIGSPYGLDNSVTAGIVSAKARDVPGDLVPFIQTDVAINPGNSGGPLINLRGEVVGINSQIYTRTGGSMGISFSIPIDEAVRVSDQLRATGRVQRGRLGVDIAEVSKDVAESIGLGKAQGAFVRSVMPGSAAEKAGIESGDIITRFDGKAIEKPIELQRLVANTKPGVASTVTVYRKGASKDLKITVGETPQPEAVAQSSRRAPSDSVKPAASEAGKSVGLGVVELTDKQKTDLKIKAGVSVENSSEQAARAGLREGDVITAVNNADVANVKEFEAALAKADKTKPISMLFRRGEWAQYAVIRPAK
jgi:serine protease Do